MQGLKNGFTVTARTNYVIDESNIEKLKTTGAYLYDANRDSSKFL